MPEIKTPEEAFEEWFKMNLNARKNSQCLYHDWNASKEFIRSVFLTGYYTATDDKLGLIRRSNISE
jgi:hypothetical protein